MPEANTGATDVLDSPAELKKENDQLRAELAKEKSERAKDKARLDQLEARLGEQAKSLMDLKDQISVLEGNKTPKSAETNTSEASMEVKFGEKTFSKGDIVTYKSTKGNTAEYYVLCNTLDDPPGLVLQSVESDDLVFSIGGDTDPTRLTPKETVPDDPDDVEPTNPPAPPNPGPPTPPNPGPPEPAPPAPEVNPTTELQPTLEKELAKLNDAIIDFAKARVERERIFSGKGARVETEESAGQLNEVFGEWATSFAALIDGQYRESIDEGNKLAEYINGWQAELNRLENIPADERPEDFDKQVSEAEEALRNIENRKSTIDQFLLELKTYRDSIINTQLMSVRKQVDDAMTEQREKIHPKLSKVSNWLRNHKKIRIAAGVALAGVSIFAGATGNLPLLAGSVALKSALQGFGTYNAVRGVGDLWADRNANKAELESIEDYTDSAKKQSSKKHRWNRGASVAAGVAATAPIVGKLGIVDAPPPPGPKPPDWLASREFAEMVHHPETFKKFSSWIESMHAQGITDAKIAEMMANLPQAQEGFGS